MAVTFGYTDITTDRYIYAVLINSSNQYLAYNTYGTFEAYGGNLADYVILLDHVENSFYEKTIPQSLADGKYIVRIYDMTGVDPDFSADKLRDVREFYYSEAEDREINVDDLRQTAETTKRSIQIISESAGESEPTLPTIFKLLQEQNSYLKAILGRIR